MLLRCPRCGGDLTEGKTITYSRVVRHGCGACRGMWFDRAELELLAEELKVTLGSDVGPEVAEAKSRPCPRCGASMTVEAVGDEIQLDVCHRDGVWFDRDELEPVLEHLQHTASTERKVRWWEWPLVILDFLGEWDLKNKRGLGGQRKRPL